MIQPSDFETKIRNILRQKRRRLRLRRCMAVVSLCAMLLPFVFSMPGSVDATSALWDGTVATAYAGGTGIQADPYLISNGKELAYLAQRVNSGVNYQNTYFKLTDDILLNNMNTNGTFVSSSPRKFTCIGSDSTKTFQGNFDGNSKTIIGLYINETNWHSYCALFAYAATGSVIKNLSVSGSVRGGYYAGGIAGYIDGSITGCSVSLPVTAAENYAGGVAGYGGANSIIENCTVSGIVTGKNYVGGVAAYTNGNIKDCHLSSTVTVSDNYVGGMAGYAGPNSEIENCTVSGIVTGKFYVAGVAGYTEGNITGCDVSLTLTGSENYVGGIAGYAGADSIMANCTVAGTIRGKFYVGGVVGSIYKIANQTPVLPTITAAITECEVTCTVTGSENYVGGVVGYAYSGAEVSNSSSSGTITGKQYVGGVAGYTDGEITVCTNSGNVNSENVKEWQEYVGGVAGYAGTNSEISNCASSGNITGKSCAGGVAGYTDGVIKLCSNTGNVNSVNMDGWQQNIGGVVGYAGSNNTISNNSNSGDIHGSSAVGGIAGGGDWTQTGSTINNNLSTGEVTGHNNYVGGIIGQYQGTLTPTNAWNNYYDNAAQGTGTGDKLTNDGAVPVGDIPWTEIQDLLNGIGTNIPNPEGNNVWIQVGGGTSDPPVIGTSEPPVLQFGSTKIAGGKYYTPTSLEGAATAATITADSAFSVYFSGTYSATCALETQTIGLKQGATAVTLPAQTTVIMLVDGVYYYKNLTADLTGSIMLNQFIQMGTTEVTYPSQTAAAGSTKQYVFIFDFSRTTAGIAAGTSNIEFLIAGGTTTGTVPTVTVAGQNAYSLTTTSGTDSCTAALSKTTAMGYDYKTDGKSYFYEINLQQSGSTVNLPVGTIVNGTVITGSYPSTFLTANVLSETTISIDMSGCAVPLTAGTYTVQVKAYASSYPANPRNDTLLATGTAAITLAAPPTYGIRAVAETRFFDASAAAVSVPITIQTLGTGDVQSTLQQKYGISYANVSGQVNQPVSISGGAANLTLPAGSAKGTYRFVLTKYNSTGTAKAVSIQNVIIK